MSPHRFPILFSLFVMLIHCLRVGAQGNNYVQNYHKYDGLALTPPMGWNSWNKFACNVDENMIRQQADAMVTSGMRDAGYVFINIDDCWHGQRDSLGFIHPDPVRFPGGMKALADYVHAKGLKLGIYSDAGSQTCGGRPGSRGYEFQDALMYAAWGIDYLKYDWCNTEGLAQEGAYKTITAALRRAGRPIILSICEWGQSHPWRWAADVGHCWRTTGDITSQWEGVQDHGSWSSLSIMKILESQDSLRAYAGPGHWNDPDMLEVGNGLSTSEDRAHFSLWAMIAAPLIAGNDLRNMTSAIKSVLLNKEVIAIDQDSLGIQGFRYQSRDSLEIWCKPLQHGDWALCFLNRKSLGVTLSWNWNAQVIIDKLSGRRLDPSATPYYIRDLWKGTVSGTTRKASEVLVPAHDVFMVRLKLINDRKPG